MHKKILVLLILVIILGVGFYAYNRQVAKAPVAEFGTSQNTATTTGSTEATQNVVATTSPDRHLNVMPIPAGNSPQPTYSNGGEDGAGSNIQVVEVDFDGKQYAPQDTKINIGDYVFFKNKSTVNFWPLAGSAATLAAYPNFSAGKPIAPGGEYKFQFTKAGNWSFGDNLNANMTGTVEVAQ